MDIMWPINQITIQCLVYIYKNTIYSLFFYVIFSMKSMIIYNDLVNDDEIITQSLVVSLFYCFTYLT